MRLCQALVTGVLLFPDVVIAQHSRTGAATAAVPNTPTSSSPAIGPSSTDHASPVTTPASNASLAFPNSDTSRVSAEPVSSKFEIPVRHSSMRPEEAPRPSAAASRHIGNETGLPKLQTASSPARSTQTVAKSSEKPQEPSTEENKTAAFHTAAEQKPQEPRAAVSEQRKPCGKTKPCLQCPPGQSLAKNGTCMAKTTMTAAQCQPSESRNGTACLGIAGAQWQAGVEWYALAVRSSRLWVARLHFAHIPSTQGRDDFVGPELCAQLGLAPVQSNFDGVGKPWPLR